MNIEEVINNLKKYISFSEKECNFPSIFDWNWHMELANDIETLLTAYEKEKEKNKELEYIIASNTTREVISNLKNSRKSREDLEMLDLGWKEELKEKFQNTRNEILSQTLIKVTDRYWMDKCLEYINNLEKELIGEE